MNAIVLAMVLAALAPAEKRGRRIYLTGESASGRAIAAAVSGAELPAASLPCGSCHGPDGRGVAEGTIVPADVRWSVLSQPRLDGRPRPRYSEALLGRAVTAGLDAAGEPLSPVMPRYRLHEEDLTDLAAYLRRLGETAEPGLTATEITVATAVPLSGPHARVGEITRAVIAAAFADVNAAGGIYGRTLRLEAIDAATQRLDESSVFAVVCASGFEADATERIPVVTPFPFGAATPSSFFLYSDLETQALALAKTVEGGEVYVAGEGSAAEAVRRYGQSVGWTVRPLGAETDVVFVIGNADAADVFRRIDAVKATPRILLAGASPAGALLSGRKISIAVPAHPRDVTPDGKRELEALAARHDLPREQLATQIATYAAVKVFLEGLKRAGRELTREKLITALEGLYGFATGLTPPITFGRGRRVGSAEAYIVSP